MYRLLLSGVVATAFTGLSLCVWRLAYEYSDLAILSLIPLAIAVLMGGWSINIDPWKARLRIALREDSPLALILNGRLRAALLSTVFVFLSLSLLAWQSLEATALELVVMGLAFLVSGYAFSAIQKSLLQHLHQPFAREFSVSIATWLVALPFTLFGATYTWAWSKQPGAMLDAGIHDALQIGLSNLPERGGWIASALAVPYGYEALKLWSVVQLKEYSIVAIFFSVDAVLFSFVLCRTAVILTLFIEAHVFKDRC